MEFTSEFDPANIQLMYHNCICMLPLNIIAQNNDGFRKEKVKESMLRISKVFQLLLPTSVSNFIKEAKKK